MKITIDWATKQISVSDAVKKDRAEMDIRLKKETTKRIGMLPEEMRDRLLQALEESPLESVILSVQEIEEQIAFRQLKAILPRTLLPVASNLKSDSIWLRANEQNFDKLRLSQNLRTILPDSHKVWLYFDSGYDIELPILAGLSQVLMCDPLWKNSDAIAYFIKSLDKYGTFKFNEKEMRWTLSWDFWAIEIIFIDSEHHEEYNLPEVEIWTILAYLKYSDDMKWEIFEIPWIKRRLKLDFFFYDNRRGIQNPEWIGFNAICNWIFQALDWEKVLSYTSPTKQERILPDASNYL